MRFLIAQTSFLGDVILSTPVCAALKRHDARAHVTVMARADTAAVLEQHPHVDAVIVDDKRGRDRGLGSLRTVRRLRAGAFDVALALHKSLRTAWILAAAGIAQRIGFTESAGWFFYHRRVDRDPSRHDVERNLSILAGLGLDPAAFVARPYVACTAGAVTRFHAMMEAQGAAGGTPLIAIAPGSAWATKRWTVEGYAALIDDIPRAFGAVPLLLGAPSDAAYAEAIVHATSGTVVNLVGQTDLALLIAAIDQSTLLVTNDSGPMHIAVGRDTPVVAIFGPTAPRQGYGPYSDTAIVVERPLSCRPCSRHGGAVCPIGTHTCMREIDARAVQRAVAELLGRDAARPRRFASVRA